LGFGRRRDALDVSQFELGFGFHGQDSALGMRSTITPGLMTGTKIIFDRSIGLTCFHHPLMEAS
ncbi:MAG: hypothetical protein KDG57_04925, partial [Rhodoferax sp.]|nr:hypothetical protein [Rhodoferax sp.]